MTELPKASSYGAPDRFPPSEDNLSKSFMNYKSFPPKSPEMKWNYWDKETECCIFNRIWNIFCECRCPEEEN